MVKKKLTNQQKTRIAKKQQAFDKSNALIGLVITRGKKHALIESLFDKSEVLCTIRADVNSIVVGDKVYWQPEGVIESVLPRQNELGRPDRYQKYKLLVANISHIVIVVAPKPLFSELLIDSYLVMANLLGIKVSIIFNKDDLDDNNNERLLRNMYSNLVDSFISHSQFRQDSLLAVQDLLHNQVSVIVGQSGVGKSTLINLLLPGKELQTSPLSANHEFGQHTTSNAYYYHLSSSGAIIDSPGVRSFGLWELSKDKLLWGFSEFRPFIGKCKFRDCDHVTAPQCAIRAAVDAEQIATLRYYNYLKLRENCL